MTQAVRNRPLLGVSDEALFVAPDIWPRLTASVDRELNALIVGSPGSGKTSVLRMLALRDGAKPSVFVDLARAANAADALLLIVDAMGLSRPNAFVESFGVLSRPARSAPDGELLRLVETLDRAPATLLLLDEPPSGDEGHRLFGRLRDELWQLDHQWVVGASPQSAAGLDRPPANAFFESRFELGPIDLVRQREILLRRLPDVDRAKIDRLLGRVERPRELISLARESLLEDADPGEVVWQIDATRARIAALTDLEQTIINHLRSHEGAFSSDPALLAALGVSQPRAAQALKKLSADGLLTARQDRHGQGRPRTVYELAPELQP